MNSIDIFEAILSNDKVRFKQLISEDESVIDQSREHSQDTTLHVASRNGHTHFVSQIVSLRPHLVEALNVHGDTPVHEACRCGSLKVLDYLLAVNKPLKGHCLNNSKESAMFLACKHGYRQLVRRLIENNIPVDLLSVHVALSRGHTDVVHEVIETCPNIVEEADENGQNLLHYACRYGEPEMVRMLLKLSPDLAQSFDNDGFMPLHLAAVHNNGPIFENFEALAPLSFLALTKQHDSVLHVIIHHNHLDAFLCLMQLLNDDSNSDLFHYRDQQGNTPLHLAISKNCLEIAKYMIKKSTNEQLQSKNERGFTALDILVNNKEDLNTGQLRQCLLEKLAECLNIQQRHEANSQEPLYEAVKAILEIIQAEKDRHKDRQEKRMQEMHLEGLQNARNTINIIAILIATVTFTGCLSPPGGFFQEGALIGKPVLGQTTAFKVFEISNDLALFLSLGIVVILVSIIPFRTTPMRKLLSLTHKLLCLAVFFLALAFIAARWATTRRVQHQKLISGVVLSICGVFLCIIFVGLSVKLINDKLSKSKWKKHHSLPSRSISVASDVQSQALSGYITY